MKKEERNRLWIVTGASGHLGNTVVRKLAGQGEEVRAFILENERPKALEGLKIEVVSGDVTDRSSLEPLFAGLGNRPVTVLHLASMITIYAHAGPRVYQVNVEGTRNMLEMARAHQADRFLYCGTIHTLPFPENPDDVMEEIDHYDPDLVYGDYAKSKAMASQLVLDAARSGMDALIVQPSGIIGPNDFLDGNFTRLFEKLVDRKLPAMIQGTYNFVDVNDVADGLISAARIGRGGQSYNLTGHNISVMEIMNTAARMTGRRGFKGTVPFWMARMAAPLAEWWSKKTKKTPVLTGYSLFTMRSPHHFSNEKAKRELGYTVRPLEESIANTLEFMISEKRFKTPVALRKGLARS